MNHDKGIWVTPTVLKHVVNNYQEIQRQRRI